jgi:hypothetical protein
MHTNRADTVKGSCHEGMRYLWRRLFCETIIYPPNRTQRLYREHDRHILRGFPMMPSRRKATGCKESLGLWLGWKWTILIWCALSYGKLTWCCFIKWDTFWSQEDFSESIWSEKAGPPEVSSGEARVIKARCPEIIRKKSLIESCQNCTYSNLNGNNKCFLHI